MKLCVKLGVAMLALALAGCQGGLPGAGSWQVGAVQVGAYHERLDVQVGLDRSLLATAAEVARVEVRVLDGANVTSMRTLSASQGTASFATLAPGPAGVTVEAYDAGDRQLGTAYQPCWITAGSANQVNMPLYLTPWAAPSPGSGGADVAITIQDGATGATAPLDNVPTLAMKGVSLGVLGDGLTMLLARDGSIWSATRHLLPDGSNQLVAKDLSLISHAMADGYVEQIGRDVAVALAQAPNGDVWLARGGRLDRLSAAGELKLSVAAPGNMERDGLQVDGADHLWVGSGNHVYRLDGQGVTLDSCELPAPVGRLALADDKLWVCLQDRGQLCQLSLQNKLLHTTTITQSGDPLGDMALDHHGNAWVTQWEASRVAKVAPDGTVLGIYPTGVFENFFVAVDAHDNVLVARGSNFLPETVTSDTAVLLSPTGRLLARYDMAIGVAMGFDAAGQFYLYDGSSVSRSSL